MTEHQGYPEPLSIAARLAILEAYLAAAARKLFRRAGPEPDHDALAPLLRGDGFSGGRLLHDAAGPYLVVGIGDHALRLLDPAGLAYLVGLTLFGPPPFITDTPTGSPEHPKLVVRPDDGGQPLDFAAVVADATLADTVRPLGSLVDVRAANLGVITVPGPADNAQDAAKRSALEQYDERAAENLGAMPISRAAYADLLASLAWIVNTTCGQRVCRLRRAVA